MDNAQEIAAQFMQIVDTARQQVAAALDERDARTQAILDTTVDGIITINTEGVIESFNMAAEHIFGYVAAEVIGQNINVLMPSPYREEHDEYLARYLRTGKKRIIGIGREVVGQRKDGTTFPLELAVSEVRFNEQRLFTGIARDVTQRKRLEHELIRASRMTLVGQLVSGIAHEIGTPLNLVGGNAELLRMDLREHGFPTTMLDTIIEQTDRITGLIAQLLTFARATDHPMEPLNLSDPLSHALRLLETRLQRERITVTVDLPDDLPLVWGAASQLQQVFINVLVNAWHAMPEGGTLTIRAAVSEPDAVRMTFTDTGIGMSADTLTRALEPFYSTKGEQGTGLGLAVCQHLVETHGGSLDLDSTPGEGTTLTIELLQAERGPSLHLLAGREPRFDSFRPG